MMQQCNSNFVINNFSSLMIADKLDTKPRDESTVQIELKLSVIFFWINDRNMYSIMVHHVSVNHF